MKALKFKYLIFLLITIAYILCNGYLFNTGDQAEHLPQVYQKLNPYNYLKKLFLKAHEINETEVFFTFNFSDNNFLFFS